METIHASGLPATPTNIHPLLRLHLYDPNLLTNQLHQRCACCLFSEQLVPDLQQQLVDIQLDRAGTYTPLHDLSRKVVCAVQSNQHALVNMLVYRFEAVEMYLAIFGTARAVVAMDVADGGREDVDASGNESVNVGWRGEEGWKLSAHDAR